MSDETVLDAVNAALGDQIAPTEPEEVETPDSEAPEGEELPSETPEGDEPAGETPEGEEPEQGPNGERERNPDGTWKKAAEKPKEGEGEKPAKVEPKKLDPVNDPIPKDLKKDTQERIRTLIDTTKTVTAERDKVKQDFDFMVQGVQATGTSPEQYGETLSWLALFNSNDPKQQEKALELVENVAERLSTLLGKERIVGDPLAAHADLKDAVSKGQITAQYAKEIARTRNGQTFRTELTTQATTQQQQQQQAAQELATARNDLSALEQTLMASDPSYAAKKAILVPALKPVFASIPPSQWKQKFTEAYRAIQINAPAIVKPKGAPANQPLRAKQPAGGQAKAPSSMLEAINGALSGMHK
jgi:hypothetical protein